jgi:hypothetical protein
MKLKEARVLSIYDTHKVVYGEIVDDLIRADRLYHHVPDSLNTPEDYDTLAEAMSIYKKYEIHQKIWGETVDPKQFVIKGKRWIPLNPEITTA